MNEKYVLQGLNDKPDTAKEVIRRHTKLVRHLISRRILDQAVVDDLVKETFLRYFRAWGGRPPKRLGYGFGRSAGYRSHSYVAALLILIAKKLVDEHLEKVERSAETLASPTAASEEESNAESYTVVTQETLNEAADLGDEDVHLYEQTHAMLEEVDEIIQRLGRDREEINNLKEETRSNISELQRMIAA